MGIDDIITRGSGKISMGNAASALEGVSRFDVVAFCAEEFQPDRSLILRKNARTRVIYAPNDDGDLTRRQLEIAAHAADQVAGEFLQGQKVLVICMAGKNRSGLVIALALHMLSGAGGVAAARLVRAKRRSFGGPALTNPSFNALLENIPPRPKPSGGIALGGV